MGRSGPEVADIFRRYGAAWREQHWASLSTERRAAMTAIERCRTAALGGHVEQCDRCGERRIAYNSCRSRIAPSASGSRRAEWIEARRGRAAAGRRTFMSSSPFPTQIAAIAFQNTRPVYKILFKAAAETMRTIAADPQASRRARSASSPCFTPGVRTSARTLTQDTGHYHLLDFQ